MDFSNLLPCARGHVPRSGAEKHLAGKGRTNLPGLNTLKPVANHPHLIALALTLSGLTSCGSELPSTDGVGLSRLTLVPVGTPEVEFKPSLVKSIEGPDLVQFRANGGPQPELVDKFLVLNEGNKIISVKGLNGIVFDHMVLEMRGTGGAFNLIFEGTDGQVVGQSPDSYSVPRSPRKVRQVHVPTQFLRIKEVERIRIRLQGCPTPPQIKSLRLFHSEPEALLPGAGEPDTVMLGKDGRLALGLSSRSPLMATLTPDQTMGGLSFTVGIPETLSRNPAGAELIVKLLDLPGARSWEERYDIPVESWDSHTFWPPEEARGNELEVRFELQPPRGEEGPFVCALSRPIIEPRERDPQTVILITSDTHRADYMGTAPERLARTPFLDELASRGYLFEDCQAEGNNTNPTHISIMTGAPIRDHGIIGNDSSVGTGVMTLTECFAQENFHTYAALSAAWLGWSGCEQGFDRICVPQRTTQDSEVAIGMLDGWLDESEHRSLFIWLHSFDPHAPYNPPAPYDKMYWDGVEREGEPLLVGERPRWSSDIEDLREVVSRYKGEVTYFDNQLKELFKDHPRLDDAFIALVGDHGENMLHPTPNWSWSHRGLSKDTLQVPMLISWPGAPKAVRVSRPIQQRNLGRTLLDICGLAKVEFPGENLLSLAEQDPEGVGEQSRFAIAGNAFFASVRRGRWMMVQGLYSDERVKRARKHLHTVSLHDTNKDPSCLVNLADQHHELTCELRTELVRWLQDSRIGTWTVGESRQDAETLKHLAALGYSASTALSDENPWIDPGCDCEHCTKYPLLGE